MLINRWRQFGNKIGGVYAFVLSIERKAAGPLRRGVVHARRVKHMNKLYCDDGTVK
jgi:hypothetical protein